MSPSFPVYEYGGSHIAPPEDPDHCSTIVLLGDSLASSVAPGLAATYATHGYGCVTVIDGTGGGANTIRMVVGSQIVDTVDYLDDLVDEHAPEAVVLSFVGNIGPSQVAAAEAAYLALIDRAQAAGLHVFVTTPPVSAYPCDPTTAWSLGHTEFRRWVLSDFPGLRPGAYSTVSWSEVLTPGGTWETFNHSLAFPDGVHAVRSEADCVHFSVRGDEVAAHEVVAATQNLWAA